MATDTDPELTGEDRCWPCTVANTAAGLVVAAVPVVAAVLRGDPALVAVAAAWAAAVLLYTGFRLVALGYLPYAERIARLTDLHERLGPGDDRK